MTITIPPGPIDNVLRDNRSPGTIFLLTEGVYTTQGCFAFPEHDLCMIPPDCELRGAGSGRTKLHLVKPRLTHGMAATYYTEILTGGARTVGTSPRAVVDGLAIVSDVEVPAIGLHLWTSRAEVTDVRVEELFGSRTTAGGPREAFGILISDGPVAPNSGAGGHLVSDCRVTFSTKLKAENYGTGIYVGSVGYRPEVSYIERSSVTAPVGSSGAHCGFAFNENTVVDQCDVMGCLRAIFVDTGTVRNSSVRRMRAIDVCWAVDLRSASVYDDRSNISISDSEFVFRKGDGWSQAVLLSDDSLGGGAPFSGIEFNRCRFLNPGSAKASKGRLQGKGISEVSFNDCRWIGAVPWEEVIVQKVQAL